VNQTFSANFFLSAKAAYYNNGFGLFARGDNSYTYDYDQGEMLGNYLNYFPVRPQKAANVDGSYFVEGLGGNHELKFGFGYRETTTSTNTHYGGNQLVGVINSADDKVARLHRDGSAGAIGKYLSFYAGDVFTKNRLSLNLGVRFDQQKARNSAGDAPANASFPNVVPSVSYGGDSDYIVDWKDFSPRVGLSYALGESRKTVARASYARYANQLQFKDVQLENPVAPGFLAYAWNDANGDRFVQPDEVLLDQYQYNYNIDPDNPGGAGQTPNRIDRDYGAAHSDELVAGIDHELLPNFAAGVAYTYRHITDLPYRPRLGGPCGDPPTSANCQVIQGNEYTRGDAVSAGGYTVFPNAPDASLVTAGGSGRFLTNQPGYAQSFNGFEMTLTKRLSNKWMGRVAFSYNLFKQSYDTAIPVQGGAGVQGRANPGNADGNPTPTDVNSLSSDFVSAQSGGSGRATFYTTPRWQVYANALVELPWRLELSGAVFGREGQALPQYIIVSGGRDGNLNALATPEIDARRYDNVWNLDLRLAKVVKLGPTAVTFSAEAFNLFNSGTVLQRFRRVDSASFDRIDEILSPRIVRFGARFAF
jgi:hypothetical protein